MTKVGILGLGLMGAAANMGHAELDYTSVALALEKLNGMQD